MSNNVALITGCSTGIGKSFALLLASETSYTVYATMRNPLGKNGVLFQQEVEKMNLNNLFIKALDVTDKASIATIVDEIYAKHNRIDLLVNNAGVGFIGTHELNDEQDIRNIMETNFFGVVHMNNKVLPLMRKARSGHVIAVSSVGGFIGTPFNDIYCASKFAVEGLYESMSSVNERFGISTTLIEPAATLSSFVANATRPTIQGKDPELSAFMDEFLHEYVKKFGPNAGQPSKDVAQVILQAVHDGEANKAHLRYTTTERGLSLSKFKLQDPTGNSLRQMMSKTLPQHLNTP